MKRSTLVLVMVGLLVLAAAGWGISALAAPKHDDMDMARFAQVAPPLPDWLEGANAVVKETYMWAAVHQAQLQYIPCYCGCVQTHDSNAACFFKRREDGTIADYEVHALGCEVCVDIARSVRQGLAKGKTLTAVRQQVDKTYQTRNLTPTNTPMPPNGQ